MEVRRLRQEWKKRKGSKQAKKAGLEAAEAELQTRHEAEKLALANENGSSAAATVSDSASVSSEANEAAKATSETDALMARISEMAAVPQQPVQQERKLTKAQRRKMRREAAEAAAVAEAEAEAAEMADLKREEMNELKQQLGDDWGIKSIAADGHCLYSAIADQLRLSGTNASFAEMRMRTREYLLEHEEEFLPFLDLTGTYRQYCDAIVDFDRPVWGGEPEIAALSALLERCIHVYSAGAPLRVVGEEHMDKSEPLRLSFHLHEIGLGNHYNSVVPATSLLSNMDRFLQD